MNLYINELVFEYIDKLIVVCNNYSEEIIKQL